MSEKEVIKEICARFEAEKKAFRDSHHPCKCHGCWCNIEPGNNFVYSRGEMYCSWECFGSFNDAYLYEYEADDYDSFFPKK